MVRITNNLEKKITSRQNSKCFNADFWSDRGQRSPEDFKVLRSINLNESFTRYYIHRQDYVIRFKNNSAQSI